MEKKIGPQCVLGLLCLLLFLLVRMLFSNVSIWELNCHNLEGSQVITIFKWEMYGRILFTYLLYPLMYLVLVLMGKHTITISQFRHILCIVPCEFSLSEPGTVYVYT